MTVRPKRCGGFKEANQSMKSRVPEVLCPALFTVISQPLLNAANSPNALGSSLQTQEKEIATAFRQVSDGKLVEVGALLGNRYDIGLLRIFRAFAARTPGAAVSQPPQSA